MKSLTKKIQPTREGLNGYARRTYRTMSKRNSLNNGLSVKGELTNLISDISIAKGVLAILSSRLQSLSTNESEKMASQHTPILLQDLTDLIWSVEQRSMILKENSKKNENHTYKARKKRRCFKCADPERSVEKVEKEKCRCGRVGQGNLKGCSGQPRIKSRLRFHKVLGDLKLYGWRVQG